MHAQDSGCCGPCEEGGREPATLFFVVMWAWHGGVQLVSRASLRVPGTSADCFSSSCCTCQCVSPMLIILWSGILCLCGVMCVGGCAGRDNSKMTGKSAWALEEAAAKRVVRARGLCEGRLCPFAFCRLLFFCVCCSVCADA
ncbi:hypothetical protein BCY84_09029 [Trypanosoma cruzi cruzi]|nr:hypothetical protein BCY84_09029 [Trypanosoma cruzi cruzi]